MLWENICPLINNLSLFDFMFLSQIYFPNQKIADDPDMIGFGVKARLRRKLKKRGLQFNDAAPAPTGGGSDGGAATRKRKGGKRRGLKSTHQTLHHDIGRVRWENDNYLCYFGL